jgi:hypothetical protein
MDANKTVDENKSAQTGLNQGMRQAVLVENNAARNLLFSIQNQTELSENQKKELRLLTATLLIKAQKRKNEKSLIAGIENDITTWSYAASKAPSVPDKVKIAGILQNLKHDLQRQKLRENVAGRELEQAASNFNLFKVKASIANPQAKKHLEELRSRLDEAVANLPTLVPPGDR